MSRSAPARTGDKTRIPLADIEPSLENWPVLLLRFELKISYWILLRTLQRLVQQSFLLQKSFALITHSAQPQSRIAYGLRM